MARLRVLISKPGFDAHWRGAITVSMALRNAGVEVVYGGNQTPQEIAQTALQEDVDAVGLSILAAGHLRLVEKVMEALKGQGVQVPVLVGGTIPPEDIPVLQGMGVTRVFLPGTPLAEIVRYFLGDLAQTVSS